MRAMRRLCGHSAQQRTQQARQAEHRCADKHSAQRAHRLRHDSQWIDAEQRAAWFRLRALLTAQMRPILKRRGADASSHGRRGRGAVKLGKYVYQGRYWALLHW